MGIEGGVGGVGKKGCNVRGGSRTWRGKGESGGGGRGGGLRCERGSLGGGERAKGKWTIGQSGEAEVKGGRDEIRHKERIVWVGGNEWQEGKGTRGKEEQEWVGSSGGGGVRSRLERELGVVRCWK